MTTVKGIVADVKYYSEESGFHILLIENEEGRLTVTGNFSPVTAGENLILKGEYVIHPKFGKQFKATQIEKKAPQTLDSITKYLKSGIIKGVGEKTATLIVNHFKLETLNILENYPLKLSQIQGISKKKAIDIGNQFKDKKEGQNAIMFLQGVGLTPLTCAKIYKFYKTDTVRVVSQNPYKLIEDIDGIGFKSADKIALDLKIDKLSGFRIKAGIIYSLVESSERNGNTFLSKQELMQNTTKLLNFDTQTAITANIEKHIDELIIEHRIKSVMIDDCEVIYKRSAYKAEKNTALKLVGLINNPPQTNQTIQQLNQQISHYQQIHNIQLNDQQIKAVVQCFFSSVSVITGGPGTGKTTIIKCLLWLLNQADCTVCLLAPTGRATKRMNESTNYEASTIHRAIVSFSEQPRQISADAVVVDEVSMVDIFLFNMLLKSLREGTRLILLGDKDQLPSVGAGNVLADILTRLPVVELTQIYRQHQHSRIITNAYLINEGKMPLLNEKNSDFFFINQSDPLAMAQTVVELVKYRLPKFLNIESDKIQTLCPLKNGLAGTLNLNLLLSNAINPKINERQIQCGDIIFRENDKVMQTVNNYHLEWFKDGERGEGVYNGDMGTVTQIYSTLEMEVLFEDGRRAIYKENIDELILSYAITVHKSQGSEFDVVIVPLPTAYPISVLTRNLLYTAITRAKKLVVVLSSEYTIKKVIANNYVQKRNSGLKYFIDKTMSDYKKLYG